MRKEKEFIALFFTLLIISLPISTSISLNPEPKVTYSAEGLNQEKITSYKIGNLNEFKQSYSVNLQKDALHIDYDLQNNIKNVFLSQINSINISPNIDVDADRIIAISRIKHPDYSILRIDTTNNLNLDIAQNTIYSYRQITDMLYGQITGINMNILNNFDLNPNYPSTNPLVSNIELSELNEVSLNLFVVNDSINIIESFENAGIGPTSVQDDILTVWTDKSAYTAGETIFIGRGIEHDDPAETVTEVVKIVKSDNRIRDIEEFEWNIPGYSSFIFPQLGLDASGVINALGEGSFYIYSGFFSSDAKFVSETSDWFTVVDSGGTVTLTGEVKDEYDNAVQGATVKFTDCSDNTVATTTTASDGSFTLTADPGSYKLKVVYNSITYPFIINGQSCPSWSAGSWIVGTLILTTKVTLTGYVKDEYNNAVQGATVKFTDCTDNTIATTTTASDGSFTLTANPGNYKLKIVYNGITYSDDVCSGWPPGSYDIGTLILTTKVTLTGYVKDEYNNAVQGATVKFTDCTDNTIATTTTASDGSFTLTANPGNYKLKAVYNSITYTFSINGQSCPSWPAGSYDIGTLILTTKVTLTGYINDENGIAVQGATVKFTDCSDNIVASDITGIDGSFTLTADPGNYKFKVSVIYDGIDIEITYLSDNEECTYWPAANINLINPIEFPSTFTLRGYLKDLDDNPLVDYGIEIYDCSENLIIDAQTQSSGYFSVSDDAGNYKIMVNMGGGWRLKLVDENYNDCFFLLGDINMGTLKINPTPDCSIFDYMCYQDNIKLFRCYWDDIGKGCHCYGTECLYGCTDGVQECDSGDYGTIVVDVDNVDNIPLQGARVYLNDDLKGYTDYNGKLSFSALYGYKDIEVNCPDGSYCDKRQVYVNGDEYPYFDCECLNLDSDKDGYTDEEERIIGLDPYDDSSNLVSAYFNPDFSTSCWDFKPLFSGFFNEQEVNQLIHQLNSSSTKYSLFFDENIRTNDILSQLNIDNTKQTHDSRKTLDMLQESTSIQHVSDGASVILILTDEVTGVTSVFPIAAACTGQIIGIVVGAGYGLKDDFVGIFSLGKMVVTGLWHLITREKKLGSLWGDVTNLLKAVGGLWGQREELIHDLVITIFNRGKWILDKVGVKTGTNEYVSFQLSFFGGYIAGYIIEQVVLFTLIITKAGQVFKVIAKGTKLGSAITDVAMVLERIGSKFGGGVSTIVRKTELWNIVKTWGDEVAENGIARLAKYLGNSKLVDDFVKHVDDPKSLARKIDDVARTYGDDVAETLVKSEYGAKALKAGWSAEELSGLYKLSDIIGENIIERAAVQYGDDIVRGASRFAQNDLIQNRFVFIRNYGTNGIKYANNLDFAFNKHMSGLGIDPTFNYGKGTFNIRFTKGVYETEGTIAGFIPDENLLKIDMDIYTLGFKESSIGNFVIPHEFAHKKLYDWFYKATSKTVDEFLEGAEYTYTKHVYWFDEFDNNYKLYHHYLPAIDKPKMLSEIRLMISGHLTQGKLIEYATATPIQFDRIASYRAMADQFGVMSKTDFDNLLDTVHVLSDTERTSIISLSDKFIQNVGKQDINSYKNSLLYIAKNTKNVVGG